MGQGQRILHLSNSADTNNYVYDTVVVGTNSTVTFNRTQYTFSGGTVVKMVVKSVEVGNQNVYLGGYLTTFMFPTYLGNNYIQNQNITPPSPIVYEYTVYIDCAGSEVILYSTDEILDIGTYVYTNSSLITPYEGLWGNDSWPGVYLNIGFLSNSLGQIISNNAEIGGCG